MGATVRCDSQGAPADTSAVMRRQCRRALLLSRVAERLFHAEFFSFTVKHKELARDQPHD
jgi:hypothetical protein